MILAHAGYAADPYAVATVVLVLLLLGVVAVGLAVRKG